MAAFSDEHDLNESDYAIGYIDVAARNIVELQDCTGSTGCSGLLLVNGHVAFDLNFVQAQNPGGSTEALVIPVRLPDCRYVPKVCVALLPPDTDSAATDDAARALLIGLGVIKPLDPSGPNKLNPAAQLLNVTPLLPVEVTSLYDNSGVAPNGLPPLYLSSAVVSQVGNQYVFDGYFFRTDSGIVFSDVFEGLIDVSVPDRPRAGLRRRYQQPAEMGCDFDRVGAGQGRRRPLQRLDDQRRLHQPDEGRRHAPVALLDQPRDGAPRPMGRRSRASRPKSP